MTKFNEDDFLDVGAGEYVLRGSVGGKLQREYDAAMSSYKRDGGVGMLRRLQQIQHRVREAAGEDEIFKSADTPVLRKSAGGKMRIECSIDEDALVLSHRAHAGAMRHRHPGRLPDCMDKADIVSQISRTANIPVDRTRLPERLRILMARATAADEVGDAVEQRAASREVVAMISDMLAAHRELNDVLVAGGDVGTAAADRHHALGFPGHRAGV
jgi:hypothetical protein